MQKSGTKQAQQYTTIIDRTARCTYVHEKAVSPMIFFGTERERERERDIGTEASKYPFARDDDDNDALCHLHLIFLADS